MSSKPANANIGSAVPATTRQQPPPNPLHIPRAGWKPPRRELHNGLSPTFSPDARYLGHYKPESAYPNYGSSLEREINKAKVYQEKFRNSKDFQTSGMRYPLIEHGRLHRSVPIFTGAEAGGRGGMLGVAAGSYRRPSVNKAKSGFGYMQGGYAEPSGYVSLPHASLVDGEPGYENALKTIADSPSYNGGLDVRGATKQLAPSVVDHELRHAWTVSPNEPNDFWKNQQKAKGPDSTRAYLPMLPHAKIRDGRDALPALSAMNNDPALAHGVDPTEQIGWLSGLQHELFGARGRRLESPEEAQAYLTRMISLPDEKFENEVSHFSSDSARGMRHLRKLKQQKSKYGAGSGRYFSTGEESSGWEKAPGSEVADKYIEWLSKLAPALVSTQNNPSAMKTAAYEPADFTKEADLSELLSGLGGQASSFINNMPNNPMWQNAAAGGGGSMLLMLLLNLLSGNNMGRGMLPALLAGGALGAGIPATHNWMQKQPWMQADNSGEPHGPPAPYEMGPPRPTPFEGPPLPNQRFDEMGRLQTLNPSQLRIHDRTAEMVPNSPQATAYSVINAVDSVGDKVGKPFRGLINGFSGTTSPTGKEISWWKKPYDFSDTHNDPKPAQPYRSTP